MTQTEEQINDTFNKIQNLHSIQQDYINRLGQLLLIQRQEKDEENPNLPASTLVDE